MTNIPAPLLAAAVDAAFTAEIEYARTRKPDGRGHSMPPEDQVRRMLEAAAPVLAEAWNLPQLQAEHEEWQRRGVKARKLRDDFWREIDARKPEADDIPEVPGEAEEDKGS